MSNKLATLYELCLGRTARLLKDTHWNVEVTLEHNPFCMLPSVIIHELIIRVVQISVHGPLESSDLHLLIRSGRVRQFTLEFFGNMDAGALHSILVDLSFSSVHLTSVKIDMFCILGEYEEQIKCALHHLFSSAPNLRFLEISIEFDLGILCNAIHLEKLVIHFDMDDVSDFLKVNGVFKPNTSLQYFGGDIRSKSPSMFTNILKYCTELISIKCDIAQSLRKLHAGEFRAGTLSPKYKIEQCVLGSYQFHYASEEDILIASVTCPNVTDLTVCTHEKNISNLSHFHNIKKLKLSLSYDRRERTDFIRPLLAMPEFAYGLTHLEFNCSIIDFSEIGAWCPNLQELIVICRGETSKKIIPSSFQNLHKLVLVVERYVQGVQEDTLVGILSNAINLQELFLIGTEMLTDTSLNSILIRNSFLHLEQVGISFCRLSLDGIRTLASRLTSLKFIDINSLGYDDENSVWYDDDTIAAVFHSINPDIKFNVSDDTPGKSDKYAWV